MPVCKFLCGHMFCIFLVCIKVALLGHMVLLCEELPDSFPKCLHHFASLQVVCEGFSFSISMPTLAIAYLFLFWVDSLVSANLYLYDFDMCFPTD